MQWSSTKCRDSSTEDHEPRKCPNKPRRLALKATIGAALEAMDHRIAPAEAVNFAFGGAQLIWRQGEDGYVAGSDHRKDGAAVGY